MILPPPETRYPWHEHADLAERWAARFVSLSIWDEARAEGWERQLKLWAYSYARERYRVNAEPHPTARPSSAQVAYWRLVCRDPKPTAPASVAAETMSDGDFADGIADGSIELHGVMAAALRRMAQNMKAKRGEPEW